MKKVLFILMAIVPILVLGQSSQTKHYAWQGKMGESISFRLELEQASNGLVIGETTYFRKNGKVSDIPVYGRYLKLEDGIELVLNEYANRKECGTIVITLDEKGNLLEGVWSHGEKTFAFNNVKKVGFSYGKHERFINPAVGQQCNGEYGFSYASGNPNMPECGGYAKLKVNGSSISWEMNQVTPNIAEGKGRSTLVGNTFSGQVSNFKFKAIVYKDCIYVIRTNPQDGQVEDFGAWATLEGIYIKH